MCCGGRGREGCSSRRRGFHLQQTVGGSRDVTTVEQPTHPVCRSLGDSCTFHPVHGRMHILMVCCLQFVNCLAHIPKTQALCRAGQANTRGYPTVGTHTSTHPTLGAVLNPKPVPLQEAYLKVYCWQFVNCLHLWTQVLSRQAQAAMAAAAAAAAGAGESGACHILCICLFYDIPFGALLDIARQISAVADRLRFCIALCLLSA